MYAQLTFSFQTREELDAFLLKVDGPPPEVAKEPRKTRKKAAVEGSQSPPSSEPVVAPVEVSEDPAENFNVEKLSKPIQLADLKTCMLDAFARGQKAGVMELLKEFKVAKASDLREEQWQDFHARCVDLN